MEGITHGIRPGSPRKVKIQEPKPETKDLSNKALRIQAKYGVGSGIKKKEEKKSEWNDAMLCQLSHIMRKPVFGVCNQLRLKGACSATGTS